MPIMSITDLSKGITPPLGRVLMIDDEHQRGWSTVFAALIFGRTDKVYKVAPLPRENSNVQEFLISHWEGGIDQRDAVVRSASELTQDFQEGLFAISEIGMEGDFVKAFLQRRQIGKYQRELVPFDVVLLDYRLHAEGREIPPNEVSGYKLSSLIHHLDPSLPIIVVSASDKVWTLLSMRNVGAWDYYLKPGVSSGNSTDDKYSSQDLKKLIKRLEQTAKYPWARVVSALNEWIQAVQFKLEKDDPARKMFKSSDRSMRAKNWRKRRITASTVLKYIAESLNEYSRLGLMESTDGVVENRPVRYNQYLISVAWESIKYTYRGIDQSDTMRYFDSISRAYRNMIAHDTLPKELPNHIHLLLQIVSLVSLLPELLAWPEVPELHELGFQVSHFSLQDQTRSFLEFISRNANNDQYFNCDSYAKNTPTRDCFKTFGSTRSGQLEGLFKRLKQN